MMIDRLGGLDPLQNLQNTKKVASKPITNAPEDTFSVSQEAKEMAEGSVDVPVISSANIFTSPTILTLSKF